MRYVDRPIFDCQPLVFYPRRVWAAGSKVKLEYVEVPQVEITYATLGSSPYWAWGYEVGINEYGVVAGNEAVFTKDLREAVEACKKGKDPKLGLLYCDSRLLRKEDSRIFRYDIFVRFCRLNSYLLTNLDFRLYYVCISKQLF